MPTWATTINAGLATLVTTIGAWLVWGPLSLEWTLTVSGAILLFLLWRGATIGAVWAWSTLLLGMESLAWPVTTMVRIRAASPEPSDEEMGLILNAVLFGLFSSVFWVSFAFGLFRREQRTDTGPSGGGQSEHEGPQSRSKRQQQRS